MEHRKAIRYPPMLDQFAILKSAYVDHRYADWLARARVGSGASASCPNLVAVLDKVLHRHGQPLYVAARCLDLIFQDLGSRKVCLGEVFVLRQFCNTDFVGNG